jgi:hypothetical protein
LYVFFLLCVLIVSAHTLKRSGDTDLKAFVHFSAMVETVGTSAYAGAAQLIHNKVHTRATIYSTWADADLCYLGLPHCRGFHLGH